MATPRALLAASVLMLVPVVGCIGFDDPGTPCTAQHAYADRLVFDQPGIYAALAEAREQANRSSEATWTHQAQGAWAGARGTIETLNVDGRVHGTYDATPRDTVPFRVHDSALSDHGPLWLDRVRWMPNGSLDRQISYHAPEEPGGEQSFTMTFRGTNVTEADAAEHVRTLHAALFPDVDYEPLEDGDFANAWLRDYELNPEAPVDADGLLAELIDAGGLDHRQAPFEGVAFPHTLGTLHLEGEDVGPFQGDIRLRLGHDVRAIAAGNDPTLVLEATPADRATVANLGSAAIGADGLEEAAQERFGNVTGLPDLALEQADHEEGGAAAASSQEACSKMEALGQPLEG